MKTLSTLTLGLTAAAFAACSYPAEFAPGEDGPAAGGKADDANAGAAVCGEDARDGDTEYLRSDESVTAIAAGAGYVFFGRQDSAGTFTDSDDVTDICILEADERASFDDAGCFHPAQRTNDFGDDLEVSALAYEGGLLYAAHGNAIEVYDVTDPDAPTLVGEWVDESRHSFTGSMAVRDGLVAVGSNVLLLDARDPTNIAPLGEMPTVAEDFVLVGDKLVTAEMKSSSVTDPEPRGIGVWDISDPTSPAMIHQYLDPEGSTFSSVSYEDGFLYAGMDVTLDDRILHVFDASEPGALQLASIVHASDRDAFHVRVQDGWAFVSTSESVGYSRWDYELIVYDVQNPRAPKLEEDVRLRGATEDLVLDGGNLFYHHFRGERVESVRARCR